MIPSRNLLKRGAELEAELKFQEMYETYKSAIMKAGSGRNQNQLGSALSGAARAAHRLGNEQEALELLNKSISAHLAAKNAHARSLDLITAGEVSDG